MVLVKRRDKEESAADERVPLKEKELMTTKRALTKLPNSFGKAGECENWLLQINCTGKNNIFSQSRKRIPHMKKKSMM